MPQPPAGRIAGHQIDQRIDELEEQVAAALDRRERVDWRAVWDVIGSIRSSLYQAWYPTWHEKTTATGRFQAIVARVQTHREQRQQEREQQRSAYDQQKDESRRMAERILSLAQAAWPHEDGFADFLATITGAKLLAEVIQRLVELGVEILTFGLLKATPTDDRRAFLKGCSQNLREAWQLYREHRELFVYDDRQALRDVLDRVSAELEQAWTTLNAERQTLFDGRRRRKVELVAAAEDLPNHDPAVAGQAAKDLWADWKDAGFVGDKEEENELFQLFKAAMDAFWEGRNADRQRRIEHVIETRQQNIRKLQGSIDHLEVIVADKREKLENVFDGRRAAEIREKLSQDIEDIRQKIDTKHGYIREDQATIQELEAKLRQTR